MLDDEVHQTEYECQGEFYCVWFGLVFPQIENVCIISQHISYLVQHIVHYRKPHRS